MSRVGELVGLVGNTRMQDLSHLTGDSRIKLYAKLEGENPASSVKDRAAKAMIVGAIQRGEVVAGKTRLIEATSGNTGIAMAMICASLNIDITLVMPASSTAERYQTLLAFGAKVVLIDGTMEDARDYADRVVAETKSLGDARFVMLNQFANADNPQIHYETTGPEIWRDTQGRVTHFVCAMGTTGTAMGCSRSLKEKSGGRVVICGCQPTEGSKIPGIRRWPEAYMPKIFDRTRIDRIIDIAQTEAEEMCLVLARNGLFTGISSGGALAGALKVIEEIKEENRKKEGKRGNESIPSSSSSSSVGDESVVVFIACDRGDRYLSEGLFSKNQKNLTRVPKL